MIVWLLAASARHASENSARVSKARHGVAFGAWCPAHDVGWQDVRSAVDSKRQVIRAPRNARVNRTVEMLMQFRRAQFRHSHSDASRFLRNSDCILCTHDQFTVTVCPVPGTQTRPVLVGMLTT